MTEYFLKNVSMTPGKRLYQLRHAVAPNRLEFCKKHGLSPNTLFAWENEKNPITAKGALKLLEAFAQEGVLCTAEWLLEGKGNAPMTLEEFTTSLQEPEMPRAVQNEDHRIQAEISVFAFHHPTGKVFKMLDDSMEPALFEEDIVGGILLEKENIEIGRPYVVVDIQDQYYIRLLLPVQDKKGEYNLASLNPKTKNAFPILFNVKPKEIYKVLWIRRKS